MKHKIKLYATALVQVMTKKIDEKKIVSNFFKLLEKNGDIKKAKEIVLLAETMHLKSLGGRRVTVETARKAPNALLKDIAKKEDMLEEKINPSLIAGVKIVINNEKQLDFSLKNTLDNIF